MQKGREATVKKIGDKEATEISRDEFDQCLLMFSPFIGIGQTMHPQACMNPATAPKNNDPFQVDRNFQPMEVSLPSIPRYGSKTACVR